jgi:energy-converting hydrogenase Eha subunit A
MKILRKICARQHLFSTIFVCLLTVLVVSFSLSPFLVPHAKAVENSWTTKTSMPTNRSSLGVAVVNGKIYAIGGYSSSHLATNEEYDPATNTWATKKPMPTPRCNFGIAVYQNKIYVIGGEGLGGKTGVNEVYDPLTDTWETKTSMPTKRAQLCANVVDGKIYLIGGRTGEAYSTVSLNEVYDPSTDTWTTKEPIPYPVVDYASAVVDNRIYVISGQDEFSAEINLVLNQIYDTETDTWSYGASIPTAVIGAAADVTTGVVAPKRIYVMGGIDSFLSTDLNQVYDPEEDVWTTGARMPTPRSSLGVAVVNDILYAIGGCQWLDKLYANNEQYTPFGYGTIPNISILSPENKTYTAKNVMLTFTLSEPISWIGYSLDDQANVTITGNTTLTGLSDGLHNLVVYASDIFGNIGSSVRIHFTIDTPPSISIVSPQNKTYEATDIPLTFKVDESVSWIGYSLDGQATATIAGNTTLTGLSDGSHILRVYANDTFGYTGASETIYFSIETQPSEPFPLTWIVAAIAIIAIGGVAFLVYFAKSKKTIGEEKRTSTEGVM